jgi:hypothetical protein
MKKWRVFADFLKEIDRTIVCRSPEPEPEDPLRGTIILRVDSFLGYSAVFMKKWRVFADFLKEINRTELFAGHQNQNQKIHHVVKIKQENVELKAEVTALRDQLLKWVVFEP